MVSVGAEVSPSVFCVGEHMPHWYTHILGSLLVFFLTKLKNNPHTNAKCWKGFEMNLILVDRWHMRADSDRGRKSYKLLNTRFGFLVRCPDRPQGMCKYSRIRIIFPFTFTVDIYYEMYLHKLTFGKEARGWSFAMRRVREMFWLAKLVLSISQLW